MLLSDVRYIIPMKPDYYRIEKAIRYIRENFKHQPKLDDVAAFVNLSPYHFQRMFTDWAGVSPKKFLQFISVEFAKTLLEKNNTLFEASVQTGLSGTGRLHDLFVTIEAMTPGEYKNGGENLEIRYSCGETPYGNILVASTGKGICHISFKDGIIGNEDLLKHQFPNASFGMKTEASHRQVLSVFRNGFTGSENLKLHLKGTPFQLKVWKALLEIPAGEVTSYGTTAEKIQHNQSSRAVGSAVGKNQIAYIIPCHRVITSTGVIGNYRWGSARKTAMIGREAAHTCNSGDD